MGQDNPEVGRLLLRTWLKHDFPSQAEHLFPLALDDLAREPLWLCHYGMLRSLARATALSAEVSDNLHAGYVYLTAYYFCLDSVYDQHPRSCCKDLPLQDVALYSTLFLGGAMTRFFTAVNKHCQTKLDVLAALFRRSVSKNIEGVATEREMASFPSIPNTFFEYESIVARSNSFLLLFDVLTICFDGKPDQSIRSALSDFAFYIQLADDLNDWKDDFGRGRFTSFLRECVSTLGHVPTIDELEEHVYLDGPLEIRLGLISSGLDQVLQRLEGCDQASEFVAHVQAQKSSIDAALAEILCIKGSFSQRCRRGVLAVT